VHGIGGGSLPGRDMLKHVIVVIAMGLQYVFLRVHVCAACSSRLTSSSKFYRYPWVQGKAIRYWYVGYR